MSEHQQPWKCILILLRGCSFCGKQIWTPIDVGDITDKCLLNPQIYTFSPAFLKRTFYSKSSQNYFPTASAWPSSRKDFILKLNVLCPHWDGVSPQRDCVHRFRSLRYGETSRPANTHTPPLPLFPPPDSHFKNLCQNAGFGERRSAKLLLQNKSVCQCGCASVRAYAK